MQKKIDFFKEAIKNIKTSGSVMPSSKFLVNKLLNEVDFSRDLILVEYGAANGVITREILKRMTPNSKLICFEINEVFYNNLKKIEDKRIVILHQSAENIEFELQKLNLKNIDYCISSLPLTMIPNKICKRIISNTKKILVKNGLFIQYQYSLQYLPSFKESFNAENINTKFVLLNLPPAFVYNCKKM